MKILHTIIAAVILFVAMQAGADGGTRFLKIADRQHTDITKFTTDTAASDVLFIGEAHDSAQQHRQQMEIIRSMHTRKLPLAIGVEMFTTDRQKDLDDWVQGKVEEEKFRKIYSSQWSYDWNLYRELFIFARDNRIQMIALNVPKPIMSKVARQGSPALTVEEKKQLPPGGPWTLNSTQMEYMKKIRSLFGERRSPIPLTSLAEAQALRNAAFAWNIARFREKAPKTKIVIIAGTWHAIRSGAPEDLAKHGKVASTVVLPQLPEIDVEKLTTKEADYVMLGR